MKTITAAYTRNLTVPETNVPSSGGWSIADAILSGTALNLTNRAGSLKVAATVNPSLSASSIAQTTATLRLDDHYGAWWYKYTSPSGGTCAQVSAGTATADVSNLTKSTKYTFKAYASSANCSGDSSAIDSVVFTTLPTLTASKITDTTATITIAGHTAEWWYQANTGPDSTCSSNAVAANTAFKDLTGLTAGTTYTYSAYSASGCANANKIVTGESFKTSDTTVSNLTETFSNSSCIMGHLGGATDICATSFTTGSNADGYTLNSITADFAAKGGSPTGFTVALHKESNNNPASKPAATLAGDPPDTAGQHTYGCSGSGCQLDASMTYYIVMRVSRATAGHYYLWKTTTSNNETKGPLNNGWSIADEYKVGNNLNFTGGFSAAAMFKVSATAN